MTYLIKLLLGYQNLWLIVVMKITQHRERMCVISWEAYRQACVKCTVHHCGLREEHCLNEGIALLYII